MKLRNFILANQNVENILEKILNEKSKISDIESLESGDFLCQGEVDLIHSFLEYPEMVFNFKDEYFWMLSKLLLYLSQGGKLKKREWKELLMTTDILFSQSSELFNSKELKKYKNIIYGTDFEELFTRKQ